jgi:hypothetical protein
MKHIAAGFLLLGIFAAAAFTAEFKDSRLESFARNGAVPFVCNSHTGEVHGDFKVCH